ncbi:MAG: N-carbamoylputrescine amidase [Clostridiales bacterium]|nr:N-carbamoylputrescine amidase [Clostridiales bacterium]
MRKVTVAATQMSCGPGREENIKKAEKLVRQAAGKGANIILLQELFETLYFCQKEKENYFALASAKEENAAIRHFSKLAKELQVVLPISFFERAGNVYYNALAVIDADGSVLDTYRKTHIPDGPCYEEKFYFTPGDTGFMVWNTKYGRIGAGICWDQWFPEAARIMALKGAELLFYPTAIGSEPDSDMDTRPHWQRCMQGHAACNMIPVIASNRVGCETEQDSSMTFYGSSFITDATGAVLVQADRTEETVLTAEFDLDELDVFCSTWGLYRDRRPGMYEGILHKSLV